MSNFKLMTLVYLFISIWTLIFAWISEIPLLETIEALLLIYAFVVSSFLFFIWLDKKDFL